MASARAHGEYCGLTPYRTGGDIGQRGTRPTTAVAGVARGCVPLFHSLKLTLISVARFMAPGMGEKL